MKTESLPMEKKATAAAHLRAVIAARWHYPWVARNGTHYSSVRDAVTFGGGLVRYLGKCRKLREVARRVIADQHGM